MKQKPAVMLIHGFGGGPFELEALKEHLKIDGYRVSEVTLPGHNLRRSDLGRYSYMHWIEEAERVYHKIRETSTEGLVIVGFSMGALIGAHLADVYGAEALVTINAPIHYWDFRNVTENLISDVKHLRLTATKRYVESCLKYPMRSLYNFKKLHSSLVGSFRKVECPMLILQAKDDDAVRWESAEYIFKRTGSKTKRIVYMERGGHGLLIGDYRMKAIEHIMAFVEEYTCGESYRKDLL